jgi:hypothetical protein
MVASLVPRIVKCLLFLSLAAVAGCSSGFTSRTQPMRTALDAGDPVRALALIDRELGVSGPEVVPKTLKKDDALLVLDRATVHQSLGQLVASERDYELADKAIDMVDLSRNASDHLAEWLLSGSAARYAAPAHEKLLVNVLDMTDYLEAHDLGNARVEARRLAVTQRFLADGGGETTPALAFGALLAGFTFEKSGEDAEARRWYDDAQSVYPARIPDLGSGDGEVLVVVGWGRVPHREAKHVPIGWALARSSGVLSASDRGAAEKIAAQSLVTWVHYPVLAPERPPGPPPSVTIDGRPVSLDATLDVSGEVRAAWERIEDRVLAAAVMRCIARVLAGKAIEAATGASKKTRGAGLLLSLVAQIALNAADVPDTRSWETLPARLGIARVRVKPGTHTIVMDSRGWRREGALEVAPGGWSAISLLALR